MLGANIQMCNSHRLKGFEATCALQYHAEANAAAGRRRRTSATVLQNLKQVAPGITNMASLSTICGRMGLKELISQAPVYTGAREASGGLSLIFRRWATKKSAGSTKNGRDSKPKNLGVKKFGGERVIPGNIIVRQRGTRFHPGDYVGMGKDHTLYALKEGHVRFERHKLSGRKWVHVDPKAGHVLHPIYVNTVAKDDAENQLC